jgi:hypothetical protein
MNNQVEIKKTKDSQHINLKDFVVFPSLHVGPVKISKDKISALYKLQLKTGELKTVELVYHYAEPVFDAHDQGDINLASMILVQVALNYGLFCEHIVFDGLFDREDRRFIMDMMENTSREIYVMKCLQPNPFIISSFRNVLPERKKTYTACRISFLNSIYPASETEVKSRETHPDKYAILSSGGKDSLLTYGLMKEIGKDTHPVFINESGRHWFTAVNGFRYLAVREANTAKVWCNSDRIYSWMLKHMPFIRSNFADIRSDEYPIRLWTVAVFLFGALPLVRKRGIGRILIGDEYDCTDRKRFQGIMHYNGLYDQSRYFDNYFTRYYSKKQWGISQFSILRSLSELLIMKILGLRYPHLQENQVSCHAAHSVEGRIYPCGKCEKCRRIMAMMLALKLNPAVCGYTDEHLRNMRLHLPDQRIHQMKSDAGHLYYLLISQGIIPESSQLVKYARYHQPTTSLRFDNERSLLSEIPSDIREPILKIYLEYADGALLRKNKTWESASLKYLAG